MSVRHARARRAAAPAALALGLLALAIPVGASAAPGGGPGGAPGPAPGAGSCSLARSTITATTRTHAGLTNDFTTYADSGVGWTGADSTYSERMSGGRDVWIFSDTFLGPVDADGGRPQTAPFLNNSFVVRERNGRMSTVTGHDAQGEPVSLVTPPPEGGWYWFGDGVVNQRGDLEVAALQYWYGGGGMWDFGWDSTHVATFDRDTLELRSLDPMPSASGVQWSSWIETRGAYTYVYGVEDGGLSKYMHVARVRGQGLTGAWEFWDGTGWSATETDTVRVMEGVANEYSVTRFRDGYLLLTQDTRELFSRNVTAYVACSPAGPFTEVGTVLEMPEVGALGTYGDGNIFAYNAHEHPELRRGNTLVVSYNVNSFDSSDLYEDVTIYRPRFVEVALDVRPR